MRTKAAILWAPNTKWSVEDIDLEPPRAGEVLVRNAGSGLCHSDEHLVTGDMALDPAVEEAFGYSRYPLIGGHEGAGEVLEVGPGVTALKPGDHVVFSFIPSCGKCPSCVTGRQQLCDLGAFILSGRQFTDNTVRHRSSDGTELGAMSAIGTFCPYTIAAEASCVKIEPYIPLDKAALVGCGIPTGWGAATYAADVRPGETVVVVGIGGVGINAVQGAAMAGARHVVVVDPATWKHEEACRLGATHAVSTIEEAQALVGDLTWGTMADKAILTVGVVEANQVMPLMATVKKGGRAVVAAVTPRKTTEISLSLLDLAMSRKELVGTIYGNCNPRFDIPRLLHLYMEGQLKIDEIITRTYSLDDINEGYEDMRQGRNFRGELIY